MSDFVFLDKAHSPEEKELKQTLGDAHIYWDQIKDHFKIKKMPVVEEWKYYSRKSGWTKKILLKKRNLFFFTPLKGSFRISFIFGEKAVGEINKSQLPDRIKAELINAREICRGKGNSA